MIMAAEIAMLILGMCILIAGKVYDVRGWRARVAGIICLLPFPLSILVGTIVGTILIAQGKQVTRESFSGVATVIEGSMILACAVAASLWLSYVKPR